MFLGELRKLLNSLVMWDVACEQYMHFRSSLENFSEGEKRRPEMRLLFAGYVRRKNLNFSLIVSTFDLLSNNSGA